MIGKFKYSTDKAKKGIPICSQPYLARKPRPILCEKAPLRVWIRISRPDLPAIKIPQDFLGIYVLLMSILFWGLPGSNLEYLNRHTSTWIVQGRKYAIERDGFSR